MSVTGCQWLCSRRLWEFGVQGFSRLRVFGFVFADLSDTMEGEPLSSSATEEEVMEIGDSEEEEEQVMSEVHLGCPLGLSAPHISHFTISVPPEVEHIGSRYNDLIRGKKASTFQVISVDEDDDLVLPRRSELSSHGCGVAIQHSVTSSIPRVGLQVWRAELVLAGFVLHKMLTSSEFNGIVSLELGSGTGLVGILLARVAKSVFITDRGDEILDNCAENVHLNYGIFKYQASVYVRELNWENSWPPNVSVDNSASRKRHFWTSSEIEEAERATLLIAADVIYSDDLTDAFFNILQSLMSQGSEKVLYLALEKRYNFSLDDLDVVANGYLHFKSYLKDEGDCEGPECETKPCFTGKYIDLTQIPQYVREYERGNDVEIWQIKYEKPKP